MIELTRRELIKAGTVLGASFAVGSITGLTSCRRREPTAPAVVSGERDIRMRKRSESADYDVLIVGAGPGGCLAARDLARCGFSVGLFDAASEDTLGKPIIIEAEQKIFGRVGIERPSPDLIPYHPEMIRVFSPRGREAFSIDCHAYPLAIALHLDGFARRLMGEATGAGARFHGGYRAVEPLWSESGVEGVRFESGDGASEIRARIVIDATGFNACLTRRLPPESGIVFPEDERHVVSAQNHFHEIDLEAARIAVDRGLHGDEENRVSVGNHGAYSTVFSFLSLKHQRAYILVGLKKNHEAIVRVGDVVERFRKEQGYYGREITGGGGLIRIHHPLDKPVAHGFMAIGEAACHVVPIHGSGVASSLYAGSLAAKAAAQALKNGDTSEEALWPYAAEFQRSRGKILACLDAVRLTLDRFTETDVADMVESGLMTKEDMVGGLLVQAPMPSVGSIPSRMLGFIRHPRFIRRIAGSGVAVQKLKRHYDRYPQRYDREDFLAWRRENGKIFAPLLS